MILGGFAYNPRIRITIHEINCPGRLKAGSCGQGQILNARGAAIVFLQIYFR
jgi:hypothetical protein